MPILFITQPVLNICNVSWPWIYVRYKKKGQRSSSLKLGLLGKRKLDWDWILGEKEIILGGQKKGMVERKRWGEREKEEERDKVNSTTQK